MDILSSVLILRTRTPHGPNWQKFVEAVEAKQAKSKEREQASIRARHYNMYSNSRAVPFNYKARNWPLFITNLSKRRSKFNYLNS